MMLWWNQRPPDAKSEQVDGFTYYLAHQLHKTAAEVQKMSHQEYTRWNAYFTAKAAVENLRPVAGGPRA